MALIFINYGRNGKNSEPFVKISLERNFTKQGNVKVKVCSDYVQLANKHLEALIKVSFEQSREIFRAFQAFLTKG